MIQLRPVTYRAICDLTLCFSVTSSSVLPLRPPICGRAAAVEPAPKGSYLSGVAMPVLRDPRNLLAQSCGNLLRENLERIARIGFPPARRAEDPDYARQKRDKCAHRHNQ